MSISGDKIREDIRTMDQAELLELLDVIAEQIRKQVRHGPVRGRLSVLYGLGSEVWEGVDPIGYLRQERDAWER